MRDTGRRWRGGRKREGSHFLLLGRCLWEWLSFCCEPSFHQTVHPSAIPACTRKNFLWSKTVSGGSRFWSLCKTLLFLVSEGIVPDAPHLWFALLFELNQHLFNKSSGMSMGMFLKRTHHGRIIDRQLPTVACLIQCGFHTRIHLFIQAALSQWLQMTSLLELGHYCTRQNSFHQSLV